ncbi:MAG: dihydrofolate reductase [Streptosporangiaceae bacterium]
MTTSVNTAATTPVITSLIVAAARNDVIGAGGALPWYLPEDLRRFRRLTVGHPVVVGRVTHESILTRLGCPLPQRTSIVVSSRPAGQPGAGVVWTTSLDAALGTARRAAVPAVAPAVAPATAGPADEVFVIGGASVYEQVLPQVDRVYLTRLHRDVDGDTVMPSGWLDGFRLTAREDRPGPDGGYSFLDYRRDLP